jgi:YgiT-type zinc finger domain-containing protein
MNGCEEKEDGFPCEFCMSATHEDVVNMCLWEDGRLIVIEDVPARICNQCLEQFYDADINWKIHKLREQGFHPEDAEKFVQIPFFSLKKVKIPDGNFPHPVLGEEGTID